MNIIDIIDGEILKNVSIKADQVDPIPVSSSYIKKKKKSLSILKASFVACPHREFQM